MGGVGPRLADVGADRGPHAVLRPQLGDPFQAGHLELHDLKIVDKNVQWTIASAVADDLRLDRYQPVLGEGQLTALSMRIMKAMSVGRLEQKQSVFTDPATGNTVAIASMTIGGYDKGKVGSFEVKDLDVCAQGRERAGLPHGRHEADGPRPAPADQCHVRAGLASRHADRARRARVGQPDAASAARA